jgi:hypothetical protein
MLEIGCLSQDLLLVSWIAWATGLGRDLSNFFACGIETHQ